LQFSRPAPYRPSTQEAGRANFKRKCAKCEHTARETAKRKVAAEDIRTADTRR
jgi:hypothetical protein